MSVSFQLGKRLLESSQILSQMLSHKNSNQVRVKFYFIILPCLGTMPMSSSPWQVSHHFQRKGKEKWVPQAPSCGSPCQVATPPGSSWARGWVKSCHCLITGTLHPDDNSWHFPSQSPAQGTEMRKGHKRQKKIFSALGQFLVVADVVLCQEGLRGSIWIHWIERIVLIHATRDLEEG